MGNHINIPHSTYNHKTHLILADKINVFLIPESHERILRRIIRRFGSFPTRTYSNRISNDANVRISYEERSGRAPNLSDVSPYIGVRWQIYGRVTGA